MARHETEMHRQRRELLAALKEIVAVCNSESFSVFHAFDKPAVIEAIARKAIKSVEAV